ncbi:MAG: FAD-dependent oxidoreductase, partial [Deltaproteobacteria bacterium]|nr:FAD-dependent oxidoreductase [Deltaproteobacteria bacterium]
MEKIKTDLAIVAAGPAGLCASVAAAEAGVNVVVFEKSSIAGGTANMGMGPFGVESNIQRRSMGTLRKEEAFKRFMDYVHWQSDAQLVHDYIWNSGPTINWLEDMGVRFAGAMKNFPASEATWHVVMPDDGSRPGARSASAMNRVLFERAQELGVKFYFNTPVKKLLGEKGKKVTGLIAKNDEDGTEYEVSAKAVIIATGGFGTNPEMVKEYCDYTLEYDMFDFMVPGIVGDGIKMAWELGAGKGRMEMERLGGSMLPGVKQGNYPEARLFGNAGAIAVNKLGYRCCDESVLQNGSISGNIVDFQKDRTLYRIMSSNVVRHYRRNGVDFPTEVFHFDPAATFEEEYPKIAEEHPTMAWVADSPEELAKKIGLPVDIFLATVERYNEQCAQ